MKKIFPSKLKSGDKVTVVAPASSLSMSWIDDKLQKLALQRLKDLGLKVSFSKHSSEIDEFDSSSIESRVSDLHDAFADEETKLVLTVLGGYNSNQLLPHLDFDLIKANPKILCGYSDITALANAIHAKTGLVTYSGPHFTSFGEYKGFNFTLDHFEMCLFQDEQFAIQPSKRWSNDWWSITQKNRTFIDNDGYWIINEGQAEGTIIGGNIGTLPLLNGTEFMPSLDDTILFLEDDRENDFREIDRWLNAMTQQPGFSGVKGIVFGRFERETGMTREILTKIISSNQKLAKLPVIANADFGHTTPMITFPIGGTAQLDASSENVKLEIIKH